MRVPEIRVFHQPRNRPSQGGPSILGKAILDTLSELEHGLLGRMLLGKIVAVENHWLPAVPVQVVYCAACPDEEVPLISQGP